MSGAASMDFVGPVGRAFVEDERLITGVMGPYGSGKTTTCMQKIVRTTMLQPPGRDGIRRARWCVVRDTYQQLHTNVLNSWKSWFPFEKHNWNGAEDRHRMRLEVAMLDGNPPVTLEIETYFRAMGDRKAEDVLKGLELTGLWLNETDTLDRSVLRFGLPRCGRYPPAKDGGCAWYGVICDFNAPDVDNWTYELLVENRLPVEGDALEALREAVGPRFGVGFHRQPGGRSKDPLPENLHNLPPGYYEQMCAGMSPNDVRRFVDNEFGAVRSGQPVYPEFNDSLHVGRDVLKPWPGVPVAIAVDGGATPAAVFGQRDEYGRIRWLNELVVFTGDEDSVLERMGAEAFGEMCGEFWLEHYGKSDFGGAFGDPAAFHGPEDDYGWTQLFWRAFRKKVGPRAARWRLRPAPCKGNRLPERLEAVRRPMTQLVAGEPSFLLSPTCKVLRRGFNNGYVIVRQSLSNGTGRMSDKPLKNDYSHVQDAGQYLNLGLTRRGVIAEDGQVTSRAAARAGSSSGRAAVKTGGSAFAPRAGR